MRQEILNLLKNRSGSLFFGKCSYAQEGEDLIVDRILQGKKKGFYVEVGCHHPFRFSNTYLFYKRGWRGVCIDPLPGTGALFKKWRPRDLTVETGVCDAPAKLTYFMFNEPALNTFDPETAEAKDGWGPYRIVARKEVPVEPLGRILDRLGVGEEIDFMSVDVEGLDMKVLRSNDWEKYRPGIMIVECLGTTLADLMKNEINIFLTQLGYEFHAKTGNSAIFVSSTM